MFNRLSMVLEKLIVARLIQRVILRFCSTHYYQLGMNTKK